MAEVQLYDRLNVSGVILKYVGKEVTRIHMDVTSVTKQNKARQNVSTWWANI